MRYFTALMLGAMALACLNPASAAIGAQLTAAPQAPAVMANLSLDINLLVHHTVPPHMTAWISNPGTPQHGSVRWTTSQYVTYSPGKFYATLPKGQSATDSFKYCLTDDRGDNACNTVTVTVFGAYVAPTPPPIPVPVPTPAPVPTPVPTPIPVPVPPITPVPVQPPSPAPAPGPVSTSPYTCVRNWYVAPGGADSASGGTVASPWKTLGYAGSNSSVQAGDCVNVADGTYQASNTIGLNRGGNANSATGYVVYRSANPHGAKLLAIGRGMQDVLDANGDYIIVDGFEIDGGNLGLTSNPMTNCSGLVGLGHHFQALNNLIHDCGGEGIGAVYKDWYWIVGNTTYNNAHFNGYQMSGISIYEPRAVSYTATSADTSATYHIIVQNNVSHDNGEWYVPGAHTDGNGIILDDFRNSQSGMAAYPYKTLVQGNTAYNNGARGVHLFFTDNATLTDNIAYNNNLDTAIQGTWRGELSNSFGTNNVWTNNQASATSVPGSQWLQYNTAVLDGGGNAKVTWTGNANFDTHTGGKSYQIDNSATATAFPAANPLGKAL
jgi:parallel beta-helix repeat protein